jgi:uncharacterized protein (TIGR02284 family)
MSNPNKDVIDVLNDLIEYSKDGEKGFKTSAEDVKNPQLKAFFVQRAGECANAAAQLQSEVRRLGGDRKPAPASAATCTVAGSTSSRWSPARMKRRCSTKWSAARITPSKAYKDAREKLVKLGRTASDQTYMLVENQLQGVQRNHDQVKALRNAARAAS